MASIRGTAIIRIPAADTWMGYLRPVIMAMIAAGQIASAKLRIYRPSIRRRI